MRESQNSKTEALIKFLTHYTLEKNAIPNDVLQLVADSDVALDLSDVDIWNDFVSSEVKFAARKAFRQIFTGPGPLDWESVRSTALKLLKRRKNKGCFIAFTDDGRQYAERLGHELTAKGVKLLGPG